MVNDIIVSDVGTLPIVEDSISGNFYVIDLVGDTLRSRYDVVPRVKVIIIWLVGVVII